MKIKIPVGFLLIVALLSITSCGIFKPSKQQKKTSQVQYKKTDAKDMKFLDHIEVKPGTVVSSRNKGQLAKKNVSTFKYSEKQANSMEELNWLQFKYAILANVEAESLANLNLLKNIDSWWGTKYCVGGSSKECVDCSSFACALYKDVYNIQLPRVAQDQFNSCNKIASENLQEGDLVFFHNSGRGISHVGVFLTNNKFVHSSTSDGVTISDLKDGYWQPRFISGGRYKL